MTWKVSGNMLETDEADGSNLLYSQRFKLNSNTVVKAIRTWVVFYNSPTFTNLRLALYENQGGFAGKLIQESINSFDPSDIYTDTHSLKGLYFTFSDIPLLGTEWYHCQLIADGYTFSEASHISWVKGYPDPEYRTGLTLTYEDRLITPYRFALVGADI